MAMKWGSCQRNTMANAIHPPIPKAPVAAVHPMSAGTAPGTAPMIVHNDEARLSGV